MIAVVLDDEGNFLSNKLGFSRNNVEAFGESIEVDDVEVATVVGGPLDEDTDCLLYTSARQTQFHELQ